MYYSFIHKVKQSLNLFIDSAYSFYNYFLIDKFNLSRLLISSSDPTRQYQDVTYVIQASTGRRESLKTSTLVILQVKTDILPPAPLPSTGAGVAVWGQALIIGIVFIVLIAVAGFFLFRKFSGHGFMSKRLLDPNSTANLQYAGSPGIISSFTI